MAFDIVNDRLEIGGRAAPFRAANSFGGRFHPTLIICHDTADRPAPKDTVNWFASKECKVSAHVVVERDGAITQMVPFDHKAWHAGKSVWEGKQGCNEFAIGIEIDNPGALSKDGIAWFTRKGEPGIPGIVHKATKEHGDAYWLPYTSQQIAAVTLLCQALSDAYPTIQAIGTHWIISPGRKVDTNPLFPLAELREAVFSKPKVATGRVVYPTLELGATGEKVTAAQEKLKELGYPTGSVDGSFGPQMRVAVLAFEAENNLMYDGALNASEHKALMTDTSIKAMPVGARAATTAADLRSSGSGTMKAVRWGKNVLGFLGLDAAAATGDQALNGGAGLTSMLDTVDQQRATVARFSSAAAWALTPKGLLVIALVAAGGGLYWLFNYIEKRRLAAHQTGANTEH